MYRHDVLPERLCLCLTCTALTTQETGGVFVGLTEKKVVLLSFLSRYYCMKIKRRDIEVGVNRIIRGR